MSRAMWRPCWHRVKPAFVAAEHPAFHPGRCAQVVVDGRAVGFVGELHPKWRQAYELPLAPVLFELDAAVLTQRVVPAFQSVPRLQSVYRDLALVVNDSDTHDAVIAAITSGSVPRPGAWCPSV
jgi:phenylalanyl-tRNA synthetase beta chain